MNQDRQSGALACEKGHKSGEKIAELIGARKLRKGSNECWFEGHRVVIKSAHGRNDKVGVLADMLERIDEVIAAFPRKDGTYDLWRMSRGDYFRLKRPSKSKSHVSNRGYQVRRTDFETHGVHLSTIRLT